MTNTRKKLTRPFLFLFEKLGGGLLVALGFVITLATVFAFQTLSTSPSTAGFQSGDTPLLSDGNAGNGAFDQSTDSLEAIRDAVDASGSDATAANQTTTLSRVGENTDAASMSDSLFAGQEEIYDTVNDPVALTMTTTEFNNMKNIAESAIKVTTATYTGNLGGSGDDECAAEFPGYHMCSAEENSITRYSIVSNGSWTNDITTLGIEAIGSAVASKSESVDLGHMHAPHLEYTCNGWTAEDHSYGGFATGYSVTFYKYGSNLYRFTRTSGTSYVGWCDSLLPLRCCADMP